MKKLIFLAFLTVPFQLFAQASRPEIPTADDGQAIVSQIKDVEVTEMISETAEFRECREKYPFAAGDTPAQRTAKLREAETCFKQKLSSNSSPERLKQLSEALNLQTYKLVKGNSSKDVQEYLTKKMITALTGVNPDEQNLKENLKFGKKKIVDQSVFIELYKTQLGKNALFEISRFCFEDLRNTKNPSPETNFLEHWKSNTEILQIDPRDKSTIDAAIATVTDEARNKWGAFTDTSDKATIYKEIFKSIQGDATPADKQNTQNFISKYFINCGFLIAPLCNEFKKNTDPTQPTDSQLDIGSTPPGAASGSGATTTNTTPTKGAAACLALNRIREYKQAIANAGKVAEYFEKDLQGGINLILKGEPAKIFGNGTDSREPTIDELTNNSATSFLEGNLEDQRAQDRLEECNNTPELEKCEGIVYKTEDLDKIKQTIELEQTLKREVEMERVRKLVEGDRQNLETYLKENGFFDILKDVDSLSKEDLIKAVGKNFEAKKLAMLNEINNRLGSRQAKDDNDLNTKKDQILDQVRNDSKEERARLAQVVLFNNIITSHLSLQRRDSSGGLTGAGRNTGAWRKEERELGQENVDTALFENLKAADDENGGGGVGNSQIADFSVLDEILGKSSDQQPTN